MRFKLTVEIDSDSPLTLDELRRLAAGQILSNGNISIVCVRTDDATGETRETKVASN